MLGAELYLAAPAPVCYDILPLLVRWQLHAKRAGAALVADFWAR